jgi:hypothetical protein
MNAPDGGHLDPETRALLAQARDMDEPNAQQRSRVLKGLEVSLATAATTAYATTTFAATAKVVLATVTLGVVSTGVWYSAHYRSPDAHRQRAPVAREVPREPALTPSAQVDEPTSVEETADAEAPVESRRHRFPRARRHKVTPSLTAETALLREVHAAIGQGNGAAALELLAAYDRRFKRSGLLREEKSAAHVLALCVAGRREQAVGVAARFVVRYPHSPLIARLQASCAADALGGAP